MTDLPWGEVERLFSAALARPADERTDFVRARAGDAELAAEVLSLLEAHHEPGLFDPLTALQDAREEPAPLEPGARLGAWEVLGELGHGGMGVVYRARRADGQFEQVAAVKVLGRRLPGAQSASRFLAERQILASLSHPNIARLLDGGVSEDGRPFYAMELVEGVPIDRYCDDARLGLRARLRLFMDVCAAVQSAHQSLVVHRDLKPANILVTEAGEPKLLDFGIAKLLDPGALPGEAAVTGAMARVLTPEFASPEQLQGRTITTASDVYQLGLLLCQLLVGARPYGAETASPDAIDAALSTLSEARPSRLALAETTASGEGEAAASDATARAAARGTTPERLRRRLRGDLDQIVLKALRPEPGRRYGTAGQLADDIARHLDGLPVRARPDSVTYRAGKFVRRHAVGLAATVGAFLLLAGFAIGIERQAERTALERDRAEQTLAVMLDVFGNADPYQAQGDTVTVREALGRGALRIRHDVDLSPGVRASLLEAIADVYANLGHPDSSRALLEEAVAARRLADDDPRGLAKALVLLSLRTIPAPGDGVEELLEESLSLLRASVPETDPSYPETLNSIGNAFQTRGDHERAQLLLEEALARHEALGVRSDEMAMTLTNLGWLQITAGAPDSAAVLFRRSVAIRRDHPRPDSVYLDRSLSALGVALLRGGHTAGADSAVEQALAIRSRFLPESHPDVSLLLAQRASILLARERYQEARDLSSRALAGLLTTYGHDDPRVANARNSLALIYQAMGDFDSAREQFEASWAVFSAAYGEDHVNPVIIEVNLARLLYAMDEREAALPRFAHAVPILREIYPDNPRHLDDLVSLGTLRCETEPERALAELEEAVTGLEPVEADTTATDAYLRGLNALGSCHLEQGRFARAREALTAALEASRDRSDDDPYRVFAVDRLAQIPDGS